MSTAAPSSALLASPPDKKRAKRGLEHSPADLEDTADATITMAATLLRPPPPQTTSSNSSISEEAFKTAIALTPHEEQLFGLLCGAAEGAGKGTVLRVAGGWVRDKLLGRYVRDETGCTAAFVLASVWKQTLNPSLSAQRAVGP